MDVRVLSPEQAQTVEGALRTRAEREARLQQLSCWVTAQRESMTLTPVSLSDVETRIHASEVRNAETHDLDSNPLSPSSHNMPAWRPSTCEKAQ